MTLTVLTPPGEEALPLAEAKDFLRIGHDGEDTLVSDLVASARARLEEAAGLALVSRTLRRTWFAWPAALFRWGIALRPGPGSSLIAVRAVDPQDSETDLTARFVLAGERVCLKPGHSVPVLSAGSRIEVDFEAGFGAADDVPDDLLHALKLILLEAYRRRGEAGLPEEAKAIIASRREVLI
ncbi:MAG: hypothetical protein RIB03_00355 [Henriciella sp.]|uniref:head-tail connector protein n=1 Tax=Henriciella sp. TaxID=1968823 RepID=UPI0032F052C4